MDNLQGTNQAINMETLEQREIDIIRERLRMFEGNRAKTAKSLDITPRTLRAWIRKHKIYVPEKPIRIKPIIAMPIPSPDKGESRRQKQAEIDGYRDPTPEERDDWYNQDRF